MRKKNKIVKMKKKLLIGLGIGITLFEVALLALSINDNYRKSKSNSDSSEDESTEDILQDSDEQMDSIDDHGCCSMCEINFENENDITYVRDDKLCKDCAVENCVRCDGCDEIVYEDELCDDENGHYICSSCRDARIPDYDFNGNSDWWRDE